MKIRSVAAPDAPPSPGGYAQLCEVEGATRLAFVSGQVPQTVDGVVPGAFADQCRLAWRNVEAQLRAADMTLDNLVKVTTFLADRAHALEYRVIRNEILGGRTPALTVVVCEIFDSAWLLEVEAVAAA